MPRVSDLYAALPGITGKLELEYEGEMRGADTVVRELIRTAIGKIFDKYFADVTRSRSSNGSTWAARSSSTTISRRRRTLEELKQIQGLFEKLSPLGVKASDAPERLSRRPSFCSKACARIGV